MNRHREVIADNRPHIRTLSCDWCSAEGITDEENRRAQEAGVALPRLPPRTTGWVTIQWQTYGQGHDGFTSLDLCGHCAGVAWKNFPGGLRK